MRLYRLLSLLSIVSFVSARPLSVENDNGVNLTYIFDTLHLSPDTQNLILSLTSQLSNQIQNIMEERMKSVHLENELLRYEDDIEDDRWWDDDI